MWVSLEGFRGIILMMALSFNEMRLYANRRILAALLAITIVALGATGAVIYCVQRVLAVRQESIQITKVQTQVGQYYIDILNAEAMQRGYLLTGDETRLEAYRQAAQRIPGEGERLVKSSAAYSYADLAKQAQAVAADRMAALEAGVTARRDAGFDAAVTVVQQGRGLYDMDRLRDLFGRIEQQQAAELAQKRAVATHYGQWAEGIAAAMIVVIVSLTALVYYLFLQAIKSERALDRAKDEFVSLASHQLRTPATGIKSILSMLQGGDIGPLNERQRHLINRATESNERGLRVVEELLNVARVDAGRLVLKPALMDIREIMESAVAEQQRTIAAKHQTISVSLPRHAVRLIADAEKLHMVISNLLDNACKYTPEGGSIRVKVRDHAKSVTVIVNDSGMGIEKDELNNIFDRFQRAHDILLSGVEGTGLGLYLVKRIVELHNGTIEVDSRPDEGSTFTLILPRKGRLDAA
jgi:signal transduction histidine kinase